MSMGDRFDDGTVAFTLDEFGDTVARDVKPSAAVIAGPVV
jgi:hypothetical protein